MAIITSADQQLNDVDCIAKEVYFESYSTLLKACIFDPVFWTMQVKGLTYTKVYSLHVSPFQ